LLKPSSTSKDAIVLLIAGGIWPEIYPGVL
jgi:hypothetical protein